MRRTTLIFCLMVVGLWGFCQTTSPEVIGSSGDHFTTPTAQMSWTIGEIQTATLVNGQVTLTQGFHQPSLMVTALEDFLEQLSLKVYPNPTSDFLNIEIGESQDRLSLILLDVNGRQLLKKEDLRTSTTLDLSAYPAGSYFLRVTGSDTKSVKTFNVRKLN